MRRDKKSILSVDDYIGNAAYGCGDDRQASRHCLYQRVWQTFSMAG